MRVVLPSKVGVLVVAGLVALGARQANAQQSGQAAFATLTEVVRVLKADAATDWSKVNLEALRQHLIDMDDVTLRSSVVQRQVNGGLEMDVTGSGRTVEAIRRMLGMHTAMLSGSTEYRAESKSIPNGMRLTVTSADVSNAAQVARLRGLGFIGLLAEGDHHARHHMALARGESMSHH